ncbi:MAG: hypothetical protein DRR08_11800 [Candidatus Parabeggiatoa sp. nov. 2]|nr:MAG: hypothetical protein B6247_08690 [Beggiatoa sp. 4572_84]RKZ60247.1 MAG: hypothetical protein DRR08_11800 [Gammaproteobacteria bacterium]
MNNVFTIENQAPTLNEADEEELCLDHELFLLDRPLTEAEKMGLYDPAKEQSPSLAQVRKRLEKYRSPFTKKPPNVPTAITLTSADEHEQSLNMLNHVDELHLKAQEMAGLAFIAKREQQTEQFKLLYKQAFDYECKAAILSAQGPNDDTPLTRSLLSKSAANLALEAQAFLEAEKMIEFGLSAEPTLAITEELLGLFDYLAHTYHEKGEYKKAQSLFEKALVIREERLGEEHLDIPNTINNLGLLYQAQGEYHKAQPLLKKALAIRQNLLDAEHPDVATSLNNLGYLYQKQGEYDKAQPLLEKALAIREKILDAEHPDVVNSLKNLGFLYQEQAKRLFEKALTILQKGQSIKLSYG